LGRAKKKPAYCGLGLHLLCADQRPFGLLATRWVSADAATDFTAAEDFGLLKSLAALVATRAEVCSLVGFFEAIFDSLHTVCGDRVRGNQTLIPA